MAKSLEAYAAEAKKSRGCWLCSLPEREEVEKAHANGIQPSVIVSWLRKERNYPEASDKRIYSHMKNHV